MATLFKFGEVGSTNDTARELLEEHDEVFVYAGHQTAGRGRKNNRWEGEKYSNLYLSYGVEHKEPLEYEKLMLMQAAGCLAVEDVLESVAGKIFRLKYPNDVYAIGSDGIPKKICGVLVEHTFSGSFCKTSIIGMGVNIAQVSFEEPLNETATSLRILGYDTTPEDVVHEICAALSRYLSLGTEELFNIWLSRMDIIGKEVVLIGDENKFKAEEVFTDGRLKLVSASGEIKIIDQGDSVRYDLR